MAVVTLILNESLKASERSRVLKKLKALPGASKVGSVHPGGRSPLSKRMFYILVDDKVANDVVAAADKTRGVASVSVEPLRTLA